MLHCRKIGQPCGLMYQAHQDAASFFGQNSRMATPLVIHALVKKRAELAGELLAAEKHRRDIKARLSQIDDSLAIFGYAGDTSSIKPRRKYATRMFKKGHLRRMVYDIRRGIPGLATNDAIAVEVVRRMKWDAEDAGVLFAVSLEVRDVRKTIGR